MNYVEAKCSQCGARIEINSDNKYGFCPHCGTKYLTKDITVNNIYNYSYNESINGQKLNRMAVLEKMLLKYYQNQFNDIDNLKEYSFKVLELDNNNVLANFVAFQNISNSQSILSLLKNPNLKISLELRKVLFINAYDCNIVELLTFLFRSNLSDADKIEVFKGLSHIKDLSPFRLNLVNILDKIDKFEVVKTLILSQKGTENLASDLKFIQKFNFSGFQNNELVKLLEEKYIFSKLLFCKTLIKFLNDNPNFEFYNKNEYEEKASKYLALKQQIEVKQREEQKWLEKEKKQEIEDHKKEKRSIFNFFKKRR